MHFPWYRVHKVFEILLRSNTAESLAAPQATAAKKGEHLATRAMDSFKYSLYLVAIGILIDAHSQYDEL